MSKGKCMNRELNPNAPEWQSSHVVDLSTDQNVRNNTHVNSTVASFTSLRQLLQANP